VIKTTLGVFLLNKRMAEVSSDVSRVLARAGGGRKSREAGFVKIKLAERMPPRKPTASCWREAFFVSSSLLLRRVDELSSSLLKDATIM
jgi:hypothetical protein